MKRILLGLLFLPLGTSFAADLNDPALDDLNFADVSYSAAALWTARTPADHRIAYLEESNAVQFADLRIPDGPLPDAGFPVVVFIHGGAWRAEWSKDYSEGFVETIAEQGFATWDVEFRRMGHRGGGYPGTFEDVADAVDALRQVAKDHPVDLSNVIAVGHSSGGHLALWLAGRRHLDPSSPLYREAPLALRGVISVAGVNDLQLSVTLGGRTDALALAGVDTLEASRARLAEVDPGRMLPLGVPQVLFIGSKDSEWRLDMTDRYATKARAVGDSVRMIIVPDANHMDVMDARSGFAQIVARAAEKLIAP